jgi:hypothetical protein
MMITYQPETLDQVRNEIEPLLQAHYLEITTNKAIKPLDVDWERYETLDETGMLRIFTARQGMEMQRAVDGSDVLNKDGTVFTRPGHLIGYFISFVMAGLHYQQTIMALNDVFYVTPEHRRDMVGFKLMKQGALDLKNLGADILTIHMKTDYPFRKILIRQGFALAEENWEKVL